MKENPGGERPLSRKEMIAREIAAGMAASEQRQKEMFAGHTAKVEASQAARTIEKQKIDNELKKSAPEVQELTELSKRAHEF